MLKRIVGLLLVMMISLVQATPGYAAPPPGYVDPTPIFGPGAKDACPAEHYPRAKRRWIQGAKDIAGVKFNGTFICFPDVQPGIVSNRVLVPARFVSEALGATVTWDGETQKVSVVKGSTSIELVIGSPNIMVNDVTKTLDVAPALYFDRTLVPLRFVSEALGARVEWDGSNYLVWVYTTP